MTGEAVSNGVAQAPARPLRVLIVDDDEDIRTLLGMQFGADRRFEVVAEAANGREGIDLARIHGPDLVILDRRMPVLGGLEALPELRTVAPDASVILYTAEHDALTHRAAIAAGALDVLGKDAAVVSRLVSTLVGNGSQMTVEVRVGPVSSAAARVWIENTGRILDSVVARPQVLAAPLPEDVVELFRSFLAEWRDIARRGGEFYWVAHTTPSDIERVVEHWAAIDELEDQQLAELGVAWSPPEGEPFFAALTAGVLDALRRHRETRRLAARLAEKWSPPET